MQPSKANAAGGNRRRGQSGETLASTRYTHSTRQNPQNQPLRSASGRMVALLKGNTIHKHIMGSKHLLKTPPAIAIDCVALDAGEQGGATRVLVLDKESDAEYRASIQTIREHGFTFNRGYGRQIALALDYWQQAGGNGARQIGMDL